MDEIFDSDLASLFDGDESDDPLLTFDLFESSKVDCAFEKSHSLTFARRSSITSVIPEDEVNGEENLFPIEHRKSERIEQGYTMDQSSLSSRPTNDKILAKEMRTRAVSPPVGILSLFNPNQLKQQLELTKYRLAESMERSSISRKRLHEQINLDQEYYPSLAFNGQRSVFSSQSRAHFERSWCASTPATQSCHNQEHSSLHSRRRIIWIFHRGHSQKKFKASNSSLTVHQWHTFL